MTSRGIMPCPNLSLSVLIPCQIFVEAPSGSFDLYTFFKKRSKGNLHYTLIISCCSFLHFSWPTITPWLSSTVHHSRIEKPVNVQAHKTVLRNHHAPSPSEILFGNPHNLVSTSIMGRAGPTQALYANSTCGAMLLNVSIWCQQKRPGVGPQRCTTSDSRKYHNVRVGFNDGFMACQLPKKLYAVTLMPTTLIIYTSDSPYFTQNVGFTGFWGLQRVSEFI